MIWGGRICKEGWKITRIPREHEKGAKVVCGVRNAACNTFAGSTNKNTADQDCCDCRRYASRVSDLSLLYLCLYLTIVPDRTMKENGFPTREYSLRRPFQDPATDPVVKRQVSQERRMIGKKYPNFFSLVKYSLLVTLLFTLCWTLLKIPLTQKELLHREIPEEMLKEIDRMTLISRMATIFLCCFGILGVLMQSFSLTLVFTVFTACRLVAIFLVPGLKDRRRISCTDRHTFPALAHFPFPRQEDGYHIRGRKG